MSTLALAVGAIGAAAGLMIGCVGVGGVIVVPALVYGLGMPIQDAIASAMMGYVLTGVIGTAVYAHAKSIRWELAGWIAAGAAPGALVGALASNAVDPKLLEVAIGALALGSGVNTVIRRRGDDDARSAALGPSALVAVGAATGVLSALTGTGGPLVLVPLLMWFGLPTLVAVGLSQAVQIPIAALATFGNFAYGDPDVSMGFALGVGLAAATWGGARIAHALPRVALERGAAAILLAVGALILGRLALHTVA